MTTSSKTGSGKRRALALLTSDASLGDSYQGALRWGVEQSCARHDVDLLVYVGRTNYTPDGDQHQLYYFIDPERVDAIIFPTGVISSFARVDEILENLRERCPVPMCSVGQYCHGIPNILVDNRNGTARLVEHLVQHHGYRNFIYITGPKGHHESDQRLIGARESLEKHGIPLSQDAVMSGDFSASSGSDAVRRLLETGKKLEVILCANDEMALGALKAATAAGLRCPENVVITGFDDIAGARFSSPPMTTVRQPATRLGSISVDYLMRILDGEESCDTITLPTDLMIRESCGCRPADMLVLPSDASIQEDSIRLPTAEIDRLLALQYDDGGVRKEWSKKLIDAVVDETEGREGVFSKTLDEMLTALPFPHLPLREFQRVISLLARWAEKREKAAAGGCAFQAAWVVVGNHMHRQAAEKQRCNDVLLDEFRMSWEGVATSLNLPVLKLNLLQELPRLGIRDGVISLFESGSRKFLLPWVGLRDGAPVDFPNTPYPSHRVVPEQLPSKTVRQSLTILPLTFGAELIGIAALELPLGIEAYALLREQISSALRAVQIHDDFLAKERLRVKIEEEHRLANERLRSLSLIAGGVAHDLNNVLGPIVGLPDTIELDLRKNPTIAAEIFEDLELLRQAGQRATHTIGDLFLLGRSHETPRTYVSLNHLLSKEAAVLKSPLGRDDIAVEIEVEHSELVIRGSKSHLARAISNLVLNAAKAIDGSGTIRIVARRVQLEKTLAAQTPIPRGVYAVVEVHDDGCGIPEEHLPRIMEPFVSVSHSPGKAGSGLGLAIVRRIVKESQGYIQLKSVLGEGTTFSLYFPLARREATPSVPPSDVIGGRERLLVVDDEMIQLRAARRMLTHLGYHVTTVQSGEAAVGFFEAAKGCEKFDLVIVDMLMPGLDGIETVEQIRQHRPGQKAIIASGYAPEKTSALAAKRHMAWLAKPYSLPDLARVVREVMKQE